MNEIHVDPNITDPVIKSGGNCYTYDGPSQDNVDAAVDSVHQTCLECETPSPSPSPSPSPVPIPIDCAGNCIAGCIDPTTLTITIAGFTGSSATYNGTYSYTLTQGNCWFRFGQDAGGASLDIRCGNNKAQYFDAVLTKFLPPCNPVFEKANIDGCVPIGSWDISNLSTCTGTPTMVVS